jgi:hypothetical protein
MNYVNCVVLCIVCVDYVVLCIVCVYMCTVLLPPGGYPIAVKRIISYHIIYIISCIIYHILYFLFHISYIIHHISYILYHLSYMIYLLTAIGLSPGGSTHLHTNTTYNNANNNQTTLSAVRALSLRVLPWHLPYN